MFNKLFKDHTTYEKVVKWFNANKYVSEIQGTDLIDYPINKVINIQSTGGKIWAIAIIDDKVSYVIIDDEIIEYDKLDKLINFKLIKNINKTEVLKNIDMNMKGLDKMKKLYNETVKNNNIEEVEEVTNEQKALQSIKDETVKDSVKYEVIEWIESRIEEYDNIEDIFNDLFTGGCESGIVTDLIYYKDTVNYFEKHEDEIKEMLDENIGIDLYSMGVEEFDELMNTLNLDSFEDRLNHTETHKEALKRVADDNNISIDKADTADYEEEVFTERYYIATELNNQDKNYLAWASFEHEASLLYDEYLDVLNELYMEEL